ncbi:MAG: hypothetical protein SVM86_06745, partial [Candidatus Cloacimonadota bacterium]|nr:hypothetical protein [Candidatus Cloacimonadota bacterium]
MNKEIKHNCQKDFFYEIALPIRVSKNFTYKCNKRLKKGIRVIVPFNHTHHTGIVWEERSSPPTDYNVKNILEIVDDTPSISTELMKLAQWISQYYSISCGQTLAAMLPAAFNIQVQQQVRVAETSYSKDLPKAVHEMISTLDKKEWLEIRELKQKLKIKNFQYWLETLESEGILEIKRSFDSKIKKKIANFIILQEVEKFPKLTKKQEEAYQYMKNFGKDFALAKIAKIYSYSIVKALRSKGLLSIEPREVQLGFNFAKKLLPPKKITLSSEQNSAIDAIS